MYKIPHSILLISIKFVLILLLFFVSIMQSHAQSWVWAKNAGGSNIDHATATATDANSFAAGSVAGSGFGSSSVAGSVAGAGSVENQNQTKSPGAPSPAEIVAALRRLRLYD